MIAELIASQFKGDFAGGLAEAGRLAVDREEDENKETTMFYFEDGSKLRACSPHLIALAV